MKSMKMFFHLLDVLARKNTIGKRTFINTFFFSQGFKSGQIIFCWTAFEKQFRLPFLIDCACHSTRSHTMLIDGR